MKNMYTGPVDLEAVRRDNPHFTGEIVFLERYVFRSPVFTSVGGPDALTVAVDYGCTGNKWRAAYVRSVMTGQWHLASN
jgi:hypothetical protein